MVTMALRQDTAPGILVHIWDVVPDSSIPGQRRKKCDRGREVVNSELD